ncbi:hypothetical protein ACIKP9_10425 [Methylobacillus methanolivorans]|uniref:Class I SAM-dependent methyltransferase n=1 Tax=Methylobacillus methanolivorans TaxID=1848927 RepID=A0ABW8GMP5_9PROT
MNTRPIFLLAPMSRVGVMHCAQVVASCDQIIAVVDDIQQGSLLHGIPRWTSEQFLANALHYPDAVVVDFSSSLHGRKWATQLCQQSGVARVDVMRTSATLGQGEVKGWLIGVLGEKMASSLFDARDTVPRIWSAADISDQPHMEQEGIDCLQAYLKSAQVYLEYGAGGSTLLAATQGVEHIYSVDSDVGFLNAVKAKLVQQGLASCYRFYHADIGPTGEWGWPTEPASASQWPAYSHAVWHMLKIANHSPDLILVDGRFRVASFLLTLLSARAGAVILFDDYFDRPYYHVVEKFIRPICGAGRMAVFRCEEDLDTTSIMLDVMAFCTNPA